MNKKAGIYFLLFFLIIYIISSASDSEGVYRGYISAFIIAGIMVLISFYLIIKVNQTTSSLLFTMDKLKESQKKTDALLSANPDLLFFLDDNGNFIDYKADNAGILYLQPDQFIGKNVKDVLPPDIAEMTFRAIGQIKKGNRMYTYEYEIDLGGEVILCEARMIPFGENKYLVIVRDISEKKKREEEEIRSHKLESLGVFAGGVAHDFNNILTTIIASVSLAKIKLDDRDNVLRLLEDAEKAAVRAGKLTNHLLAFSKGGTPLKEITSIENFVTETAEFILSGSKTALSFDIESGLKPVDIDRGQIDQVLQNILFNALQAMPSGGRIEISIKNIGMAADNLYLLPAGDYAAIAIKDHGEGIEAKNLNKIFDPYYTTRTEGNGLGLTICQTIIKRHEGAIGVSSTPGEGSVFTIYLPVIASDVVETSCKKENVKKADLSNLTVLIMDDEPQLRSIMEEVLKDEGADIIQASDGNEAIDIFERRAASGNPVKIVIADLTIPGGMGGMEAVRILRGEGTPFKAIVISGYSTDPVISEFRSYGFDAYLLKPFSAEELLKTVTCVL